MTLDKFGCGPLSDIAAIQRDRQINYRRIPFDLGTARENLPIAYEGRFLYVESLDGHLSVRLNETRADLLPLNVYSKLESPFWQLYFTNEAQAGKTAVITISNAAHFSTDFEPARPRLAQAYASRTYDLTGARTDADISGDLSISETDPALGFTIARLTGTASVKLNTTGDDAISLLEGMHLENMRFTRMFLSNTAQSGDELVLFVPRT